MKKHYETHVEDTDKLISVAGPELDYKSWYEQYRKLMEERAQRKYGLYTPTSEGDDDDFPSIPGMIARYSAKDLTNEQMAANPVWVDKTGNGHDLQMKNFAWKEGSGISDIYPGAIVFDGVDDYGICENFPILTKEKGYTVVVLRQWITRGEIAQGLVSNVKNWLNNGAFLLEYRNIQANHLNKPISFGAIGSEMDLPHILTYQTSKSCNGVSITTGNFEGTDVLHVGKLAPTNVGTCINAAIWELVFLDHDATEEELTKIKDYFVKTYPWLFPAQAWTVVGKTNEDTDRATIANITGNGNNLVLSNFGFAEGSGYNEEGEYAGYLVTDGVDDIIQSKRFLLHRNWTMVGDWRFMPPEKNTNSGIVKSPAIRLYNQLNNIAIYINRTTNPKSISGRSIKAVCSDGRIYLDDWSEFLDTELQTDFDNNAVISIANYGVNFTKMIFKNLSFYDNQLLSKDDCIKAYNYLQTLKAK